MVRPDILLALLPVLAFLGLLISLDSYKLVRLSSILLTILAGAGTALAALGANSYLLAVLGWHTRDFSRYVAPLVEELLKGTVIIVLLRNNRIGFMVDGALRGFAVGSGFALVENLYYYTQTPDATLYLWVIRGFGTAIMHGGTSAMVGIISRHLIDRYPGWGLAAVVPGMVVAVAVHSLFNHFPVNPLISTLLILLILPALLFLVFRESERGTREWLGVGFDSDRELLAMITTGTLAENRIGQYLHSLSERFRGEAVADMLCYLRLHLELSVRAKGMLLMREAGFEVPADPDADERFAELRFLERSIGPTGRLALHPFLHTRRKDLWQITMLK